MRIHHLNCGSFCPHGRRLVNGEGGLLERGSVVCHCLAIETGDGLVLVDTGFGMEDARNPRQLGAAFRLLMEPRPEIGTTALRQIEALGFEAGDVKHIVLSHLDLDHAGGLPDFPEAEVHVFAPELAEALHPSLRERTRYIGGAHWKHKPRWVEHGAGGDDWFGFSSVRILPGLDTEVLLETDTVLQRIADVLVNRVHPLSPSLSPDAGERGNEHRSRVEITGTPAPSPDAGK